MIRSQTIYKGRVQGVGFRWRVRQIIETRKLTGFVRNKIDGTVELLIEGEIDEVSDVLKIINETMKDYWISKNTDERKGKRQFTEFSICD